MRYAVVFGIIGSMMLSACSDTPPKLRDLYDPYAGPEEFAISPNLELEMPQDLASLPAPTPGGKNLTDPNPKGDAIALLGGDPNRVTASQSGTRDGALLTYATRFGFDPNIRETVSEEDRRFRLTAVKHWMPKKRFSVGVNAVSAHRLCLAIKPHLSV